MTTCETCIHGCLTRSAAPCDRCEGGTMHERRPVVVIAGKPLPLRWTERTIPTEPGSNPRDGSDGDE